MTHYYIETRLGNRWTLLHVTTRHKEALNYVKDNPPGKYGMRIVKVNRTIVFQDNNEKSR